MKLSSFLHDIILAFQEFDLDFDAFSKGQLESKEWLVDIMKDIQFAKKIDYGMIFILCGWYGILPSMIWLKNLKFKSMRSFDIDESCREIANRINRTNLQDEWRFQAVTKDIFHINFNRSMHKLWSYGKKEWNVVEERPDTIINTSCEHTDSDWFHHIPKGKNIILQSNDFLDGDGHINCVDSLDEFKLMYPLETIYYAGKFNFQKYTRFMLIGVR